jgi:hypothetical protein
VLNRRQKARYAVIEAQSYDPWEEGTNRPEIIAVVYRQITANPQITAHTGALAYVAEEHLTTANMRIVDGVSTTKNILAPMDMRPRLVRRQGNHRSYTSPMA